MRKLKKMTAVCMMVMLVAACLPQTVWAAESYGYEVVADPSPAAVGSEVTLTFRLTDYTESKSAIRGFQLDITNVDSVFGSDTVCNILVQDTEDCISNTAKYQSSRDLVRYAYAKMSGTMSYEDAELLEVRFVIPETYTSAGVLSFPLRVLIQNEAGDKLTYNDTIEVAYAPEGEIPEQPEPDPEVVSVDVEWGAMEFSYTEGVWDPKTHTYEGACWTDNGTGYVTVHNTGAVDTTAIFVYETERTDISGSFDQTEAVSLKASETVTANLTLSGVPSERLTENTVVGQVTVRIGGE